MATISPSSSASLQPASSQADSRTGLSYLFGRMWQSTGHIEKERQLAAINLASGDEKKRLFLEALTSKDFHILIPGLRTVFKELDSKEQDCYLQQATLEGFRSNKPELLKSCLSLIDFTGMQTLLEQARNMRNTFDLCSARRLAHQRIQEERMANHPLPSEFKIGIPLLSNLLTSFLNTLIYSTNILDLGRQPQSSWDANFQLEVYYKLASIPITLFFALQTYITNPLLVGAAFSATMLAALSFLYAYLRWLQPTPTFLSDTIQNLTEQVRLGEIGPVAGRDAEIAETIRLLSHAKDLRKFPILVGETGVGKNETINGLAYLLEKGSSAQTGSLKGKTVFLINTADLLAKNSYGGKSPLDEIKQRIGARGKEMVLIFNEAHAMLENPTVLEKIKTSLDPAADSFPNCIFITSKDKYQKLMSEASLANRLKEVLINPLDTSQIVEVLKNILQKREPDLDTTDEQLLSLIGSSTLSKAIELLYQNLDLISDSLRGAEIQNSRQRLIDEVNQLKAKIPSATCGGDLVSCGLYEKIMAKEEEVDRKTLEVKAHQCMVKEFKTLQAKKQEITKSISGLLAKIKKHPSSELKLEYLFAEFFLLPAQRQAAADFAREKKLTVRLPEPVSLEVNRSDLRDKRDSFLSTLSPAKL